VLLGEAGVQRGPLVQVPRRFVAHDDFQGGSGPPDVPAVKRGELGRSLEIAHVMALVRPHEVRKRAPEIALEDDPERVGDQGDADRTAFQRLKVIRKPRPVAAGEQRIGADEVTCAAVGNPRSRSHLR
jgi:hypothetical protein